MNKKVRLLVILLLISNSCVNASEQKLSLTNLSLLYAGSGLGLWSIANIIAELSGATRVYQQVGVKPASRRFSHWEYKDGTESTIKKNLLWIANSSFKASELAITPLFATAMVVPAAFFDFMVLMTSGAYDIKRFFTGKRQQAEGEPSLASVQFSALKFLMKEAPQVFLSIVGGFGVPLILQTLYKKLQK